MGFERRKARTEGARRRERARRKVSHTRRLRRRIVVGAIKKVLEGEKKKACGQCTVDFTEMTQIP